MASFGVPSFLLCIAPNYYTNRYTRQCAVLLPEQVHQMYLQEQSELQQRYAQQYATDAGYFAASFQAQAQPIITNNYGLINFGSGNFNGHQAGNGNQLCNPHIDGRTASAQVNFSTAPVDNPAPASASAEVIDLTEDDLVEVPIAAPSVAAPASRTKASSSFWRKGQAYLSKMLNNQSGSNAWRLLGSMSASGLPEKKHRYCQAHWPTDKAAYDDILEMSSYFIDADEMLMYASKWDQLAELSAVENPSDKDRMEREQLEKEVAAEKASLEKALPGKKRSKQELEAIAQWGNWVTNLSREKFTKAFGTKKTHENVKKVVYNREKESIERSSASKKRKTGTLPVAVEKPRKKPNAGGAHPREHNVATACVAPEPVQEALSDQDAEGETDDEIDLEVTSLSMADLEQEMLESFQTNESPSDAIAPPSCPLQQTSDNSHSHFEDASHIQEQATPPIAFNAATFGNDITTAHTDEGYSSCSPRVQEPTEQATAQRCCSSPATARKENTVVYDEAFAEQVTYSTPSTDEAPQEEHTVVADKVSEANIDNLFEDDNTPEDVPAATSEVVAAPTIDEIQVAENIPAFTSQEAAAPPASEAEVVEDLPAPLTAEEAAALNARNNELTQSHSLLAAALKTNQSNRDNLEDCIAKASSHVSKLMRKRLEQSRPANEVKVKILKHEIEQQERELERIEQELAAMPSVQAMKKEIEAKKVAESCGGLKMGW